MSEYMIRAEHLSKRFILGHERQEKYTALRDVIANSVKGALHRTRELVKGNVQTEGDLEEEFWALRDVNFEIKQGDRVGIIGRNGAGKSTLLKVLSRITEPTAGKITLRGRVASLLEVGTGFHPELTGRENVFLNGAILGMGRNEIRRKFDEIVAFAEVEKFLDTPVKRYSSGMYVRLAFAVAAHLEPEILIVDEVLAVGDAQFQKKCLGKMEDVSKNEGRTVLFVSHNMGVVAQLCNRAIMLNRGQVELDDKVSPVIDRYISSASSASTHYVPDAGVMDQKSNLFTRLSLLNKAGQEKSDFAFDEHVCISVEFRVKDPVTNLQVGIGIQDKYQNRVTTLLRAVTAFRKTGDDRYTGVVELPASLIAPNAYSLTFALWAKDIIVSDLLENMLPFRIHDNGSDLAVYEELDYGSFIINPTWT